MESMLSELHHALAGGQELTLATIIRDGGSTPRTAGSRMIVHGNGDITGTIGGGAIEGEVMQRSMRCFETHLPEILSYDLGRNPDDHGLDLICGGRMQVLIEHVPQHPDVLGLYTTAQAEIKHSRPFTWITKITGSEGGLRVEHAIRKEDATFAGAPPMQQEVEALLASGRCGPNGQCILEDKERIYVLEAISPPKRIVLFGGGHVAKDIAELGKTVGFRIIVFDDRAEFANAKRFPDADRTCVCPEYAEVFESLETNQGDYLVIVTRGHRYDKQVLEQALASNAGYIGMIGSRTKRDTIYKELQEKGVPPEALAAVHCPIGLAIKAETPAEIAVSVVAQLIEHRAARKQN